MFVGKSGLNFAILIFVSIILNSCLDDGSEPQSPFLDKKKIWINVTVSKFYITGIKDGKIVQMKPWSFGNFTEDATWDICDETDKTRAEGWKDNITTFFSNFAESSQESYIYDKLKILGKFIKANCTQLEFASPEQFEGNVNFSIKSSKSSSNLEFPCFSGSGDEDMYAAARNFSEYNCADSYSHQDYEDYIWNIKVGLLFQIVPGNDLDVGITKYHGAETTIDQCMLVCRNHISPYVTTVSDIATIMTHEIGHAVGLEDCFHKRDDDNYCIMHRSLSDAPASKRTYIDPDHASQIKKPYGH